MDAQLKHDTSWADEIDVVQPHLLLSQVFSSHLCQYTAGSEQCG